MMACLLLSCVGKMATQEMSTSTSPKHDVQRLSADLVSFISRSELSTFVVEVEGTQWTRASEGQLEVERGIVRLRLILRIHGNEAKTADVIQVPAKRIADRVRRFKYNSDEWNNLPLNNGDLLILICQKADSPGLWRGVAAEQITSPQDAEVASVRKCYEIEDFQGSVQQKSQLIEEALKSDQSVLRFYALDYLARQPLERQLAVELIGGAISSQSTAAAHKLQLGSRLTDGAFFGQTQKTDSSSQRVVAILALGLVNESDFERRTAWARLLASTVLLEFSQDQQQDKSIRLALVRSVRSPSADQVIAVLSDLANRSKEKQKDMLLRLLEVWGASKGSS
jgi:hypothetical protein